METKPSLLAATRDETTLDEVIRRIRDGVFYEDYDWAAGPALRALDDAAHRLAATPQPAQPVGVDKYITSIRSQIKSDGEIYQPVTMQYGAWEAIILALTQTGESALRLEWRLLMFLEILSAMGGKSDATEYDYNWINAFCEPHEGRDPDTFNLAIDRGFTTSSHDSDSDSSTVYLTDAGRAALATPSPVVEQPGWKYVPVEPTEERLAASEREWDGRMSARSAGVWQAMLAAAPSVHAGQQCPSPVVEKACSCFGDSGLQASTFVNAAGQECCDLCGCLAAQAVEGGKTSRRQAIIDGLQNDVDGCSELGRAVLLSVKQATEILLLLRTPAPAIENKGGDRDLWLATIKQVAQFVADYDDDRRDEQLMFDHVARFRSLLYMAPTAALADSGQGEAG